VKKLKRGFTLLELMIVMVIMALLVGVMVPSINFGDEDDQVKEASMRFKAVFDLASEYAMLNNYELGIIIKDNNYRFVAYDGQRWSDFAAEKYFEPPEQDEELELELELEGLVWAENSLLNSVTFEVDEEDDDDSKEMLSPQIFILSSGDITPFRLTFSKEKNFGEVVYYQVTGDFATPVTLEGPLDQLP
jgi:general secretion pathway protein H